MRAMCSALKVSPSGYYAWRGRPESERSRLNRKLLEEISRAYEASDKRYGSPNIYHELKAKGTRCSKNRVARLMRVNGIRAKLGRRFVVTTDSKHNLPVAENHLNRQFTIERPNEAWVSDITYIWTREGWLYLAVVIDLFSRQVVGWSAEATADRALVLGALEQALQTRRPQAGLLLHSDRGCQYASTDYQAELSRWSILCSMSRKGNCWDNAPAESFFASLKTEMIHQRRFQTRREARTAVFEYIEVWYNRQRLHSSLGYLSPVTYETQMANQLQRTIAA